VHLTAEVLISNIAKICEKVSPIGSYTKIAILTTLPLAILWAITSEVLRELCALAAGHSSAAIPWRTLLLCSNHYVLC